VRSVALRSTEESHGRTHGFPTGILLLSAQLSPKPNWLQARLLFQRIREDAFDLGQQQRRITKELFFPESKEENLKNYISATAGISSLQR